MRELDADGAVLRRAAVVSERGDRPVAGRAGSGELRLSWPEEER